MQPRSWLLGRSASVRLYELESTALLLTETEFTQLQQLADTSHTLETQPTVAGKQLLDTETNAWAWQEVLDWRAQHPTDCVCFRSSRRTA